MFEASDRAFLAERVFSLKRAICLLSHLNQAREQPCIHILYLRGKQDGLTHQTIIRPWSRG